MFNFSPVACLFCINTWFTLFSHLHHQRHDQPFPLNPSWVQSVTTRAQDAPRVSQIMSDELFSPHRIESLTWCNTLLRCREQQSAGVFAATTALWKHTETDGNCCGSLGRFVLNLAVDANPSQKNFHFCFLASMTQNENFLFWTERLSRVRTCKRADQLTSNKL